MPVPTDVISTVGAADSNSYISIADADQYNENLFYGSDWSNTLTPSQKATALIQSTKLLDEWVTWDGDKVDDIQRLQWPRYDVYGRDRFVIDSDVIPIEIQEATAEMARLLLNKDLTKSPDTQGFSEMKVSSLQLKIDKQDRDSVGVIPESVVVMVEPYGTVRNRGAMGTVELVRA